jgi:hypothetical protein
MGFGVGIGIFDQRFNLISRFRPDGEVEPPIICNSSVCVCHPFHCLHKLGFRLCHLIIILEFDLKISVRGQLVKPVCCFSHHLRLFLVFPRYQNSWF